MSDSQLDWCSFYALFWNDKGINLKLRAPDTVLLRNGKISAWWATDLKGYIKRHKPEKTSWEAIRSHYVHKAVDDSGNTSRFVGVVRKANAPPRLVKWQEFTDICENLSKINEQINTCTKPPSLVDTPFCIQLYVQPHLDLRFITTYICNGSEVVCSSFPRRYSRRYLPMGAYDTDDGDENELAPEVDPNVVKLDMNLRHQLQAVRDPPLRMHAPNNSSPETTSSVVKYVHRAHGLTLAGLVCEYVRDYKGELYLTAVLRAEWAAAGISLAANVTGANLQCNVQDEEEAETRSEVEDRLQRFDLDGPALEPQASSLTQSTFITEHRDRMETAPGEYLPRDGAAMWAGAHTTTSRHEYLPRSPSPDRRLQLDNEWPSGVHHQQPTVRPRSARPPSRGPPSPPPASRRMAVENYLTAGRPQSALPRLGLEGPYRAEGALGGEHDARRPRSAVPALLRPPPGPSAAGAAGATSTGRGSSAGGRRATAGATAASGPGWWGGTGAPDRRMAPNGDMQALVAEITVPNSSRLARAGKPVMLGQVRTSLRDTQEELAYQNELAQASSQKLRNLERERESMVQAFNSRIASLEGTLYQCKQQQAEADRMLKMKNDAIRNTQTELESLNEELLDLKETLDEERVSMMATVQQYHAKKRDLDDEREDFQDQRTELEEAISMEKEGLTALRKQAAEYQTLVDIEKRDMGALPSAGGGVSFHRKGDRSPTRESAAGDAKAPSVVGSHTSHASHVSTRSKRRTGRKASVSGI